MCAGQSVAQWVRLSGDGAMDEGQRGRQGKVRPASSPAQRKHQQKDCEEREKERKYIYLGFMPSVVWRNSDILSSHVKNINFESPYFKGVE